MNQKLVIIINGRGGVGKDTLCSATCGKYSVQNISAIDPIKEIAYANGWNGEKDAKSRKYLHDLKELFVAYNDLPTNYLHEKYEEFLLSEAELLFVHIREPEEIRKFERLINTHYFTVLVKRNGMDEALGNGGDDHVEEYDYDFIFYNDLDLESSCAAFVVFIDNIWWNMSRRDGSALDMAYDSPKITSMVVPGNRSTGVEPAVKKPDEIATPTVDPASGAAEVISIVYHCDDIDKLTYIDGKSDWIDLRVAEDVSFVKGEFKLISLGVSMKLPEGYEAHVVPRSSTFKNYGLLQTNSCGIIDQSYCGQNDIWKWPAYATRDTVVRKNDRICQFRIVKNQPRVEFQQVEQLDGADRGGFGSTGK